MMLAFSERRFGVQQFAKAFLYSYVRVVVTSIKICMYMYVYVAIRTVTATSFTGMYT